MKVKIAFVFILSAILSLSIAFKLPFRWVHNRYRKYCSSQEKIDAVLDEINAARRSQEEKDAEAFNMKVIKPLDESKFPLKFASRLNSMKDR